MNRYSQEVCQFAKMAEFYGFSPKRRKTSRSLIRKLGIFSQQSGKKIRIADIGLQFVVKLTGHG
ncbi:MAG: hypothetical protein A3J40_04505 [Erythrobacter sp. RIFCSPHIGHO2_12_FULL_63_10]|nr:MAG: hypothetical protein A3J40_04505 [Erythrobacter sp. RIFCSPHIGHO2_12_FULL_63_10]